MSDWKEEERHYTREGNGFTRNVFRDAEKWTFWVNIDGIFVVALARFDSPGEAMAACDKVAP